MIMTKEEHDRAGWAYTQHKTVGGCGFGYSNTNRWFRNMSIREIYWTRWLMSRSLNMHPILQSRNGSFDWSKLWARTAQVLMKVRSTSRQVILFTTFTRCHGAITLILRSRWLTGCISMTKTYFQTKAQSHCLGWGAIEIKTARESPH